MADVDQKEQELIEKIRTDKPDDFRLLIDAYQQRLFMYILRYINDQDKAEDILQDAFIKMYTNLNSFDVSRPFSPWAYRITHNEVINAIKKTKPSVSTDDNEWLPELIDDNQQLMNELDQKMQNQQLYSQMSKLPMKYREVLVLHYFQSCDYQTISNILHIPSSTVGTRIKRAKAQLKRALGKEYANA
jgi:RNA polymerase sigma-70 factor, ECF subfamily